jgi:hypothetical protein
MDRMHLQQGNRHPDSGSIVYTKDKKERTETREKSGKTPKAYEPDAAVAAEAEKILERLIGL